MGGARGCLWKGVGRVKRGVEGERGGETAVGGKGRPIGQAAQKEKEGRR